MSLRSHTSVRIFAARLVYQYLEEQLLAKRVNPASQTFVRLGNG